MCKDARVFENWNLLILYILYRKIFFFIFIILLMWLLLKNSKNKINLLLVIDD